MRIVWRTRTNCAHIYLSQPGTLTLGFPLGPPSAEVGVSSANDGSSVRSA